MGKTRQPLTKGGRQLGKLKWQKDDQADVTNKHDGKGNRNLLVENGQGKLGYGKGGTHGLAWIWQETKMAMDPGPHHNVYFLVFGCCEP